MALHGSWNRTVPDGYKVVRLDWQEDGSIVGTDFLWGFERDGDIVGRPVDIVGDGEGGYFISDDYARVIYRVSRNTSIASAADTGEARTARVEVNPELAAAGETLYYQLPCTSCHGDASPTPVALRGLAEKYTLQGLSDYFLTPTPPMPRYPLSAEERDALAHFLLRDFD